MLWTLYRTKAHPLLRTGGGCQLSCSAYTHKNWICMARRVDSKSDATALAYREAEVDGSNGTVGDDFCLFNSMFVYYQLDIDRASSAEPRTPQMPKRLIVR